MRCSSCKENKDLYSLHECVDCKAHICNRCIHDHNTKFSLTGKVCECPLCIPNNPTRYRKV